MKFLAAVGSLFLSFATLHSADQATLIAPQKLLPGSTFELRFSAPMVTDELIGKEGDSPLLIEPPIPGKWMWLSAQSGVYRPTEAPKIGTRFRFLLRNGIKKADGDPLAAGVQQWAETPPFQIKGWYSPYYISQASAPEVPEMMLLFSADVDPVEAGQHIWFVDAHNRKVAAVVEHEIPAKGYLHTFPTYRSNDNSSLTWEQQFIEYNKPKTEPKPAPATNEDEEEDSAPPPAPEPKPEDLIPQKNLLRIKPAEPLPPGKGWRLWVVPGLYDKSKSSFLSLPYEVALGTVLPFEVASVTPNNFINTGKHLVIRFSKNPNVSVKEEHLSKWITVEPAVPDMKIKFEEGVRSTVVITGKFELAHDYTVRIESGFPGEEVYSFNQAESIISRFVPVPPRLYFQQFDTPQQSVGSRQFHLKNVNVRKFKVTAKRVQANAMVNGLLAYRSYFTNSGYSDESLSKVDPETIPGEIVWQKEFTNDAAVDESKVTVLNWDEILGVGKTGTIFVTVEQVERFSATMKRAGTQAFVQVTDLGVAWKYAKDGVFFHVFSHATGQPCGGVRVAYFDNEGFKLHETTTSSDGTARLQKSSKAQWLVVSRGEDQHAFPFGYERDDQEFQRFQINADGDEENIYDYNGWDNSGWQGMMFSDRPVYKPGEKVFLKAIARHAQRETHTAKVSLRVIDPRGTTISDQKLNLSETGALDAEIKMPAGVVGRFSAYLNFSGDESTGGDEESGDWGGISHSWLAEEYVPNAFEIKMTVPENKYVGEAMEIGVDAKYYMGKALSEAQVKWSVNATDKIFSGDGLNAFRFGNALRDHRLEKLLVGSVEYFVEDEGQIDEKGHFGFDATIPANATMPIPQHVRIVAEITDQNQQTIVESKEFTLHSSDFYIGISQAKNVIREGEQLGLGIVAVSKEGVPMEPQPVRVKLTHVEWQTNPVEEAGQTRRYRTTPILHPIAEITLDTQKLKETSKGWETEGSAPGLESFKVVKPGLYFVEAEGKDGSGRKVISRVAVHVYGKEEAVWNYRNRFQVELVPDKAEYRAGEEATVMIKTPIGGEALVTVEREGVRRHFTTKVEGNAPAVRIPIVEGDAPNVFVSVMIFRGSNDSTKKYKMPEYRIGYARLNVVRPEAELSVTITPKKPDYRPGEQVEVVCEVVDHEGYAVSNAEVTLWAADEGVLSLTGFDTPDLLTFFTQPLQLSVSTGLTIPYLLNEDMETITFDNKGYLVGDGEEDGPRVRRNFLGTACWHPTLKTDLNGQVKAVFKAPDGLTRYRVMAVVQNERNQFGRTESAFEINKPFMLEPAPPRFGRSGDDMLVRAVLHNTTKLDGEAEVSLELGPLVACAESTKRVQIAAGKSVAVDFQVKLQKVGSATWTWKGKLRTANGGEIFSDAAETKFDIHHPVQPIRQILTQSLEKGTIDLLKGVDPRVLGEGDGVIKVTISNSRLLELNECVNQLLHYPYGCVEQTTSSTLPWLALKEIRGAFPSLSKTDEQFNEAIAAGMTRLLKMQTSEGGLAYWPGEEETNFWGSAYGAMVFARAKKAGLPVPEEEFGRLCKYLSDQLRGSAEVNTAYDFSPRVMACYALALAGRAEPAYHELLFKKRETLSAEMAAMLALAIMESGGDRAMAEQLLTPRDGRPLSDPWYGSVARAHGVRLMAWAQFDPKAKLTREIYDALFKLKENGHWETTQGNIWALFGISEYTRKSEGERKGIKGTLKFAEESKSYQLPAQLASMKFEFPLSGKPTLTMSNDSATRLHAEVSIEVWPRVFATKPIDRGFNVVRTYQRVEDDGKLTPLTDPKVGDQVLVTISFSVPQTSHYVAIDDPLPAIFEAINPEFKSQGEAEENAELTGWRSFSELRNERALFFGNSMSKGKYEIRYLARVRAAGTATAPATKIEEMYHPDRYGLSGAESITAKPLE